MDNNNLKILAIAAIICILLATAGVYFKFSQKKDTQVDTLQEENISKNYQSALDISMDQSYVCDFDINDNYLQISKDNFGFDDLEIIGRFYFDFREGISVNNGETVIGYIAKNIEDYNKMKIVNSNGRIIEDELNLTKYSLEPYLLGYEESKTMTLEQYEQFLYSIKMKNCRLVIHEYPESEIP